MLIVSGRGLRIDGGGLFAIDGSTVEQIDHVSSSGLAFDGIRLARSLETNANTKRLLEIVVYDEHGVVRYQRIDESRDTHDLHWDGDDLVVVATWYNAVRWFAPNGDMVREVQFPGEIDAWHLNCLTNHDGVWYATAFGAFRTFRRWMPPTRTAQGRILELETGRIVVDGLSAPHHPRWIDGEWIVCNSELKEVVACDPSSGEIVRRVDCGGWTRGLAFDEDFLYVGTSKRTVTEARATVVVVDRKTWNVVERLPISAQEIYDLAIVPESIVHGVRTGFETNPDRAKERRQWALLEELGCPKPRTLWPTGDPLRWEDFRVTIEGTLPDRLVAGEYVDVPLRITNRGKDFLTTAPPLPVFVSYKWLDPQTGDFSDDRDAHRTWLPRTIYPNETIEVMVRIITTTRPGSVLLRVSLVQEGRSWFDDIDPASALESIVKVAPEITHPARDPAPAVRIFTDRAPVAKRELRRLRARIASAPLLNEPVPMRRVHNFFSPGVYAGMVEYLGDAAGVAIDRTFDLDTERMRPSARAFWHSVHELLASAEFSQILLDQFPDVSRARFGALLQDQSFAREVIRGTVVLTTGRSEDRRALLRRRPGSTFIVRIDVSPNQAESEASLRGDAGARANSADIVAFESSEMDDTAIFEEDRADDARWQIIAHFIARNARPRNACNVPIAAGLPKTMPSASTTSIPYRLTNQSDLALVSALPCTTQVGYRWFDGESLIASGSTALPQPVDPGESIEDRLEIASPERDGVYRLAVAVVQDDVAWFDDLDPENGVSNLVSVGGQVELEIENTNFPSPETEKTSVGRDTGIIGDIVNGLNTALGDGWYPVEFENNVPFRWGDRDAVIHVALLREFRYALKFVVEPGPGVGVRPFMLTACLADGTPLERIYVQGRQSVSINLPRDTPQMFSVVLNAEEGGVAAPNDERILNFRVFEMRLEKADDVFPIWVEPLSGFYEIERAGDRLFRWVHSDAIIALSQPRGTMLRLDVESGPGFESAPFTLTVLAADGTEVTSALVSTRVTVEIPLEDRERFDSLTLRADGGGHRVPGDDRILNFRVFARD